MLAKKIILSAIFCFVSSASFASCSDGLRNLRQATDDLLSDVKELGQAYETELKLLDEKDNKEAMDKIDQEKKVSKLSASMHIEERKIIIAALYRDKCISDDGFKKFMSKNYDYISAIKKMR